MVRKSAIPWILALALAAAALPLPSAAAGEWTLLSSYGSGDYGTDTAIASSALTLHYVLGDDLQLRVEAPLVYTETSSGVVCTGAGMVPVGGEAEDRRRGGGGSGGGGGGHGGGNGSGMGGGSMGAMSDSGWSGGPGDMRVALSKRLAGGGISLFRFDAGLEVKAPTADEEEGLGTGEADYRLGLTGDYRFWSSTLYAGVGWNYLGDPWWGELNEVLDLYVGLEGDPVAGERLIVSGWISLLEEVVDGTGRAANLGASIRGTGRYRWYGQVLVGTGEASPDVGLALGLSFGRASAGVFRRGGIR